MTREQIIEIIVKYVDYETHGKLTIPVLEGDKLDSIADEILAYQQPIPTDKEINDIAIDYAVNYHSDIPGGENPKTMIHSVLFGIEWAINKLTRQ